MLLGKRTKMSLAIQQIQNFLAAKKCMYHHDQFAVLILLKSSSASVYVLENFQL